MTELDLEMGKRAIRASAFQFLLLTAILKLTPFSKGVPCGATAAVACLLTTVVVFSVLCGLQRYWLSEPSWRPRWLFLFRSNTVFLGLAFGFTTSSTLRYYGPYSFPAFVLLLSDIGITSIAIQGFALDLALPRLFVLAVMGPVVVFMASQFHSQESYAIAVALLVYVIYVLLLSKSVHKLVWATIDNHAQTAALLDAIPGEVVWLDSTGHYLGANQRFLTSIDWSARKMLGLKASFHDSHCLYEKEVLDFVNSKRESSTLETEFELPSGLISKILAMRKYASATGPQSVVIAIDTTEKRRAERELAEACAKAYESSRMAELGVMAAGISHEIGNPLQAMRLGIWYLRERAISAQLDRQALIEEVIQTSNRTEGMIERISKIIQGLRTFARDGDHDPLEPLNIWSIFDEILDFSAARLQKLEIRLDAVRPEKEIWIDGRRTQLGQVLINLINNSIDAIESLPEKWIRFEAFEAEEGIVEISMTDSGSGIPDSIRSKIFLPFFTTKQTKGTGLGLSISRSIIEDHKGYLFLDPKSQHTRLVARLPRSALTLCS
jgi:signal transduction histidine kinase